MPYSFGVIGLGVMGHNLALNMERNGFSVAGFDLDAAKTAAFTQGPAEGKKILGAETLQEFINALDKPRRILIMVPAGAPVDGVITSLKPYLEAGDLLIDGGNTFFQDTDRRNTDLAKDGIHFIGCGVSGGEEGALLGPSLMPGGQPEAYVRVEDTLNAISAKVDGEPCVSYIGPRGAGHYVKMVHNGIEYGDMQLIAEAYDILHRGLRLSNEQLADVFTEWNNGKLGSFLIEITADIFTKIDAETGQAMVDVILDEARQKGTGKWTSQNSFDLGAPVPAINASVDSRNISAFKDEREFASQVLLGPHSVIQDDPKKVIDLVRDALYAAKISSYAQGFSLLSAASREYEYNLNLAEIARIWRGGCIIRAKFLNEVRAAFSHTYEPSNLMVAREFIDILNTHQPALRETVRLAAAAGIPVMTFSASLAYYDAYRSERLPANLIQAQRDYFGAHTFQRVDRDGSFHADWTSK